MKALSPRAASIASMWACASSRAENSLAPKALARGRERQPGQAAHSTTFGTTK